MKTNPYEEWRNGTWWTRIPESSESFPAWKKVLHYILFTCIIIKQLLINYFVLPKGETVQIDYFVYVAYFNDDIFLNCIKAPLTRDWWFETVLKFVQDSS